MSLTALEASTDLRRRIWVMIEMLALVSRMMLLHVMKEDAATLQR